MPSPLTGTPGTLYTFTGWSDSGAETHSIDVTGTAATYTARFLTQYELTLGAAPASFGSVSPASGGLINAGSSLTVTAEGIAPYTFSYWSGTISGDSNPISVTMSSTQSVTANFVSADIDNTAASP
jgi:hypothetical protein